MYLARSLTSYLDPIISDHSRIVCKIRADACFSRVARLADDLAGFTRDLGSLVWEDQRRCAGNLFCERRGEVIWVDIRSEVHHWDHLPSVWKNDPMMHVLVSVEDFKLSDGCSRRYIGNSRPAVIVARASPSPLSLSGLLTHNARGRPPFINREPYYHFNTSFDHQGPHVYSAIDVVSCNASGSTFLLNSSACLQGHPICPCRVAALLFNVQSSPCTALIAVSAPSPSFRADPRCSLNILRRSTGK